MRRFQQTRSFPENARVEKIGNAEVGQWEEPSRLQPDKVKYMAKAYYGKRNKPDFYYYFGNEDQRAKHIARYLGNCEAHEKMMLERKANRVLKENPIEVGDIYRASWGYDQTNVNFYKVIEVKGQYAIVCEIGYTSQGGTGNGMADYVMPSTDSLVGSPMRKKIQTFDGGKTAYFTISDSQTAYKWDGQKEYRSWYA